MAIVSPTKLRSKSKHRDKYESLLEYDNHITTHDSYNIITICLWVYFGKCLSRTVSPQLEAFESIGELLNKIFVLLYNLWY